MLPKLVVLKDVTMKVSDICLSNWRRSKQVTFCYTIRISREKLKSTSLESLNNKLKKRNAKEKLILQPQPTIVLTLCSFAPWPHWKIMWNIFWPLEKCTFTLKVFSFCGSDSMGLILWVIFFESNSMGQNFWVKLHGS